MDPQNVPATIAGVASAFIGFTGVIFAAGRFAQGAWMRSERNALVNMLIPALAALFLAFVPMVAPLASGMTSWSGRIFPTASSPSFMRLWLRAPCGWPFAGSWRSPFAAIQFVMLVILDKRAE